MRNGMRSLWDFDAEDGGSDAMPPTEMGYGPSRAVPPTFDAIGSEIQARLQAGDPPGKIAMYLEQLEPGLGRALLGHINQAAGSMKRVSIPFLPQQSYRGSPERAISPPGPTNGMPTHQNLRSDVGGEPPQAVHRGTARSLGVNPLRLASAGAGMPNHDKVGLANGFYIGDHIGRPSSEVNSDENRPAYRQIAYRPGDNYWGPRGFNKDRIKKALILAANPQIKTNFDRTVKAIVGDSFSQEEMNLISREIIDNISDGEGALFVDGAQMKDGIVYLNEGQWTAVHRLVGTIPKDKLGQRVRAAVAEAAKRGRLRRKK